MGIWQKFVSCHLCNKIITQSSNIEKHEGRMHIQDLPHKCKNCEVKLVNTTTIIDHSTDMHGAENTKDCKYCDKRCSKRDTLKEHVSSHNNVRNYECTICVQNTRMEHRLHPTTYVHEANPQKNVEESVDNIRKHTGKRHGKISNSCTTCDKDFTISNIENHMWRVHETLMDTGAQCKITIGSFIHLSDHYY